MSTRDATARDICTLSLQTIGFASSGGIAEIAPEDMEFAFNVCNGMLDAWSMDRLFIFNVDFTEFALTSGQQDYGIGPNSAAPFDLAVRPSQITSAQLKITQGSSAPVYVMLYQLDDDGWSRLPVLAVPPSYPTAFYYSPSWPDGLLRIWVIPQGNLSIRLELWNQFSQFPDLGTAFSFPQGYYEAIYTNLAVRLCTPAFGIEAVPQSVASLAAQSKARIESLNMVPPPQLISDFQGGVRSNDRTNYINIFNPSPIWYSGGSR